MRPDRVAEESTVVPPPQAVAAPVLLVVPADRQVGGAPDLVEDDGAVADGGAEQRVTALAQGVEERIEPAGVDDQGVAGFHQEPLLFPEKRASETPCVSRIKPIEAVDGEGSASSFFRLERPRAQNSR